MKPKYMAIVLLVAVLALLGTGCNKVTGGGWFIDEATDHKITFGFNAQPIDGVADDQGFIKAKGQFQLVDHDTKEKMHGTFTATWATVSSGSSGATGTCSINGQDDVEFYIAAADGGSGLDAEDHITIFIYTEPEETVYAGSLKGGNIKVHEE